MAAVSGPRGVLAPLALYRTLPEGLRRALRPLNLADECASFLPARPRAAAQTGSEMLRRLIRLRRTQYPLRRFEGAARPDGAPLSLLLAADELSTRFWTRTLFRDEPVVAHLGHVPALGVRRAAERVPLSDFALWQVPWPLSRASAGTALVPSSVPLWLDTSRALDAIVTGAPHGRASRKDDVRRVRRLGLAARVVRDSDVDWFRRTLYEPYGRRRFGDLFAPIPPHVFRHARRAGWLILLEADGRTVAGAVLERWGGDVRILAFGVELDGPFPTGLLLAACYYHAIEFAVRTRVPRLSLGTTRPVLTDGVLGYKRKWGAYVGRPSTWEAFLFRCRNTPAVRGALAAAPLIVDRGARGLAAVVGLDERAMRDDLLAHVDTPGIAEIVGLSVADPAPVPAGVSLVRPGDTWPSDACPSTVTRVGSRIAPSA